MLKRLLVTFGIIFFAAACLSGTFEPKGYLAHPYCCIFLNAGTSDVPRDAGPRPEIGP